MTKKRARVLQPSLIKQIQADLERDDKGLFLFNNQVGKQYSTEELRTVAFMLNKILNENEDILYLGSLCNKFNQMYNTALNREMISLFTERTENEMNEYKLNDKQAAEVAAAAFSYFKNIRYQIEARQAEKALNNKTNAIYTMFLQKAMDRDHFDDKAALSQGQNIFNIQSVTVKPVLPASEDSDK